MQRWTNQRNRISRTGSLLCRSRTRKHSYFKRYWQNEYVTVSDAEAVDAFLLLNQQEGILRALESCQAIRIFEKLPNMTVQSS